MSEYLPFHSSRRCSCRVRMPFALSCASHSSKQLFIRLSYSSVLFEHCTAPAVRPAVLHGTWSSVKGRRVAEGKSVTIYARLETELATLRASSWAARARERENRATALVGIIRFYWARERDVASWKEKAKLAT